MLDEISLRIGVGEHTAILGPNGSGKSSLIKLISHQYHPHTGGDRPGTIEVLGRERWNILELRTRIGIVSADLHQLFPTEWKAVRAKEAVVSSMLSSYSLFAHHVVTPQMWERAEAALTAMEIDHLADRPVTEMSTGELRRVLIARALAPDPEALLLDEPTTGLDLVTRQRFLETLRKIAATKTLVLVTHHIEEIIPEVRRVVLLREGRVWAEGAKAETLTADKLSAAFGARLHVEMTENGYYTAGAEGLAS